MPRFGYPASPLGLVGAKLQFEDICEIRLPLPELTDGLQVEMATLKWVAWFNQQRLLGPIGYISPSPKQIMRDYQQQIELAKAA